MGKGSARRPGTNYADNYDAIFRKPEPQHVRDVASDVLSQRWSKEAEFYASMPPANTCQHCKEWSPATGHCYGEPFGFVEHGDGFRPPADFGCNRWEAKV